MDRPYLFLELTNSLCPTCLQKIEAKIVEQDNQIFMLKRCPTHGPQKVLLSTDPPYYHLSRQTLKPGQMPAHFNTPIKYGCPYDCGLCPDHEQHSCLTLIEVTDACNLTCPICYANSSPKRQTHRPLEQIEAMLDAVVRNESEPDVVQISGGEPTLHPQFWQILDAAKKRPIKHLMVNTNGLKIASDPHFAERLATYMPGFELYLQFDSLRGSPLRELRGEDLTDTRRRALERLNHHNISTTLVVTLKKGLNDHEIGDILTYALKQPCVRGVTFQPIQHAGRAEDFNPATDRLTLSEVRQQILKQFPLFTPQDIIPVPCHPDCLAMAYALKLPSAPPNAPGASSGGSATAIAPTPSFSRGLQNRESPTPPHILPLTSLIDPKLLLHGPGNTIVYERDPHLRNTLFTLFSTAASPATSAATLKQLLCCLPLVDAPGLTYDNVFRVLIMQFLDPHNFDVRSVKKTCVHIAHPDAKRIIPFDTYNLFYRDDLEQTLPPLRQQPTPLHLRGAPIPT